MSAAGNQEILRALGLRAKLSISSPDDPEEEEADRAAAAFVARSPAPPIAGDSRSATVRRSCANCEEDAVQRKPSDSARPMSASASMAPAMKASRGDTLAPPVRREYESFFGADFSRIRIHADDPAGIATRAASARAFASGPDLYFAPGRFDTSSTAGRRLLAHELTHTLQGEGTVRRQVGDPLDAGVPSAALGAPIPTMEGARSTLEPDGESGGELIEFGGILLSADREFARRQLVRHMEAHATIADGEERLASLVEDLRYRVAERPVSLSDISGVSEQTELMALWIARAPAVLAVVEEIVPAIVLENADFLAEFHARAEIAAAGMLDMSQERVASELARYGLTRTRHTRTVYRREPEGGRSPEEETYYTYSMARNEATRGMATAASELARQAREIKRLTVEQNALYRLVPAGRDDYGVSTRELRCVDPVRHAELAREIGQARQEYARLRFEKERDYPILAAYAALPESEGTYWLDQTIDRLSALGRGSTAANARTLYAEIEEKQRNIQTTWEALESGELDLWHLPPVIAATQAVMGIREGSLQARLVREIIERRAFVSTAIDIALGVFALALGLIAAIPSGGSSLVAAGTFVAGLGAAGISTYFAAEHLQEYLLESAASGTDFDRARAVSSADPSLFWLAVDIIGAVLDLAAAAAAFRALATTVRPALAARRAARTAEEIAAAEAQIDRVVQQAEELRPGSSLGDDVRASIRREAAREGRTADRALVQWEEAINPESRALLVDRPEVRVRYAEMSPGVRQVLTFCGSVCIIPSVTPAQAQRLEALLTRLGEGDSLHLRQYLHAHADDLETALARLDTAGSWDDIRHIIGEEFHGASLPAHEDPFRGLTQEEIDTAVDEMFSPAVRGESRPTVEGHRVATRTRPRLDIQDIRRLVGETARQALARARRVIGQRLEQIPSVHAAWERARAAVLETHTLTASNYSDLYDMVRRRFWSEVRGSPEASAHFTGAGFVFPEGGTTAPLLSTGADVSATEIRVSLDHILEKAIGDNWRFALDADNLRMEFSMPNTYREIIQARHPELR